MKYILISLCLFACNNVSRHEPSKLVTENLDTIKTVPAKMNAKPLIFEAAFINGTTARSKKSTAGFYGITIGKIKIPSGRIVACDPLHIEEYGIPFTQSFPTGEFPVQLSIITIDAQERIAYVRINFSDAPVEKWEMALLKGQEPIALGKDDIHGYGVDASVGIFMDEETSLALNRDSLTSMDAAMYQEMDKHYHNGWKYTIYNAGKNNVAAFTSGFGDGRYATYIGFDAAGKPCRLLTDFDIFDWSKGKP